MPNLRFAPRFICFLLLPAFLAAAGEHHLIIMHTNDMHASFIPHEATWITSTPRPMIGGMVRLQEAVDSIRATGVPTLLLDAGDVMTGNPIAEMEYRGAFGGALFEMMNRIGYGVWCPGNHDLDISQANLRGLTEIARFPTVCANLVNDKGEYPVNNKPFVVLQQGRLRIGVIGLISQELYDLVSQKSLTGLKVLAPDETAQRFIDELRQKVDLVVLLTHEGAGEDKTLAKGVHGADVIVGGHSHTRLRAPQLVNGVRIVQAGSNCEDLGVLDITFSGNKPVGYSGRLVSLWSSGERTPGSVKPLADSMQQQIDRNFSEVIGTLPENMPRETSGNPLVAYVSEAQREAAYAEIGFMNIFGVRKDLTAGKITKRDLFEVLPFRNMLVTFQLTGAELDSILRYYVQKHPAVVITGIAARWKTGKNGDVELRDQRVGSRPLEQERSYICAASDFLVGEAEKYLGMRITKTSVSQTTVYDAVEGVIRKEGTMKRKPGMQIERVK